MQSKIFVILDPQWTKKSHGSASWQQSLMANDWITRSRWECNKRPTTYCYSQNNKGFLKTKMTLAEDMEAVSWCTLILRFLASSHYLNRQGRIFFHCLFLYPCLAECFILLIFSEHQLQWVEEHIWRLWMVLKYLLFALPFSWAGCQPQHQIWSQKLSPRKVARAREILLFFLFCFWSLFHLLS